jgi:hypothetical protein
LCIATFYQIHRQGFVLLPQCFTSRLIFRHFGPNQLVNLSLLREVHGSLDSSYFCLRVGESPGDLGSLLVDARTFGTEILDEVCALLAELDEVDKG